MTEKRFKIADYPSDIEDVVTGKKYAMSSYYTHMKIICDLLNATLEVKRLDEMIKILEDQLLKEEGE